MSTTTYATGGQDLAAGRLIVTAVSCLSALLLIGALIYSAGTGQRHKVALAAAECEPNLSPSGVQCTTMPMLVGEYLAIAKPAIQQLDTDVAAYNANQRQDLVTAEAALTAEAASERALDARLAGFPFPPVVASVAKRMLRFNQARAELTAEQALSSTLTQLRSFNARIESASAVVQTEMNLLLRALQTRPTTSQEP